MFACLSLRGKQATYGRFMDSEKTGELEGQTSINELLDQPVGVTHIQMALPILVQLRPGEFRRLS